MKIELAQHELATAVREYAERKGLLNQAAPDSNATINFTSRRTGGFWDPMCIVSAEIQFDLVAVFEKRHSGDAQR
jgi:hypothetical protein